MGNNCLSIICCCFDKKNNNNNNKNQDQIKIKNKSNELSDDDLNKLMHDTKLNRKTILNWHEQFLVSLFEYNIILK